MKSLAVKYRPKTWEEVTEQEAITAILQNQIATDTQKHAYLFTGPAGCGKTTCARIFANDLDSIVIELDAASNNGVDDVRQIGNEAVKRPLHNRFKVFIVDECHSLSNNAWQAFLKLLEDPPASAVFVFCTTDPQKIPATILSRVQRYDFSKMSFDGILRRLEYILQQESENVEEPYTVTAEAMQYIAKLAEGGMRDAITMLDQCLSYTPEVELKDVLKAIGSSSYDVFFDFTVALINKDATAAIEVIDTQYNDGKDLKQFMRQFMFFLLDVAKYQLFQSFEFVQIPDLPEYRETMDSEQTSDILDLIDWCQEVNNRVKWDSNPRGTIGVDVLLKTAEVAE